MSASLVGSEMCIRDSTMEALCFNMGSRTHGSDGGGRSLNVGTEPNTVSYTHLTLPTICSV
eukprot:4446940-Alexandrium_andersonii.AAC.1